MTEAAIQQALALATQFRQAGRQRDAERVCRQILADAPGRHEVVHLLGLTLIQCGDVNAGLELLRQAVRASPASVQYLNNLAVALTNAGQAREAIEVLTAAIAFESQIAESHYNLGNALYANGQVDEAAAAYRRAIQLRGDHYLAHNNLGTIFQKKGQLDEAITCFREALRLRPNYANSLNNLGAVLRDKGRSNEAIASWQSALQIDPNHANACYNLANSLRDQGRLDEANALYDRAIQAEPDFADAHYNLAHGLLAAGNLARGWREYEWRLQRKDSPSPPRNFVQPRWDGQHLRGRTILLHAEQGLGDTLQFVRYVPAVAALGGKVILGCPNELLPLLTNFPGTQRVIANTDSSLAFDLHCPLPSLPMIFNTTLQTIPATVPYLHASDSFVEKWRPKLQAPPGHLRIGLAWAGNPTFAGDQKRSMSLESLAMLGTIPNAAFFSLQKGVAEEQAKTPPAGMHVVNLASELKDFSDTAAVLSHLDLVISVDTAVAHLAGAMGRPVWVLLPFLADWRWFLDREDSPWYPTMRLFRQKSLGGWNDVIGRVADELARFKA